MCSPKDTQNKTQRNVHVQRWLYGERCVWCQCDLDWTSDPAPVDRGLRCGDSKAVNGLPACATCIHDRGDLAVSDYALHAARPNWPVLWNMLRNVIRAKPYGRMAALARKEQEAMWQGIGSGAQPTTLGPNHERISSLAKKRQKLWDRFGNRCVWCSCEMKYKKTTLEHLRPQSQGGTDQLDNLALACMPCNSTRGSIPVDVWARRYAPKPRAEVLAERGYAMDAINCS